jgi:hypothetical protein
MSIAVGSNVSITNSLMSGVTTGAAVNDDGLYLVRVQYTDLDGETQERYFEEDQLTVV